jgi:branched-chain amino acid transport system permease protein
MLELVTVSLLNGVVYACCRSCAARAGLTLIFSMMGVLNFAHASLSCWAQYCRSSSAAGSGSGRRSSSQPLACAALGAGASSATRCGASTASGHVAEILFTFGLAYVIEEIVTIDLGPQRRRQTTSPPRSTSRCSPCSAELPAYKG